MTPQTSLSSEAHKLLKEILAHKNDTFYWENRFKVLSKKDDAILRGCLKELNDNEIINVLWRDNIPIHIQILKNGYLYEIKKSTIDIIKLKNFTVFENFKLKLSRGINILVGENGTGKTHLLKILCSFSNYCESSNWW